MLSTPHILIGAAIGSQIPYAWQVVPAAAASHFVLDSIPHVQGYIEVEDLKKKEMVFLLTDLAVGFGILTILSLGSPVGGLMWVGGLAAILPDFHHIFQTLFGPQSLKKYDRWHMKFHWKKDMRFIPGVATQLFTIFLAILLISRFV